MLTDSGLRSTYPPACYADVETACVNGTLLIRTAGATWRVLHAIVGRPASERMKRDGYLCRREASAPGKGPVFKGPCAQTEPIRFRHTPAPQSAAICCDPPRSVTAMSHGCRSNERHQAFLCGVKQSQMTPTRHFKTIVMSDIHLGSKWSKAKEANRFLRSHTCDTLILCGDVIDGWELVRGRREKWKRRHTNFISRLLDIQHDTHIIYLRGNHDDFLDRILPLQFANVSVLKEYVYTSGDKRYYVLHGDVFDHVTSSMRWLAKVGDVGYSALMWFNRLYNRRRLRRGLPYYSISQRIKQKVKASVSYISDFEQHLVQVAAQKGCSGVICGHIHQADKRMIGDILYLNSGDWVESLTALAEDYDGNWEILRYEAEKTNG